ncbi:MAG: cysteine desulfurase [Lachnospiraceae bacterium]|nr:cysteine desulfurase [Lachnospiraceae bacterium]
MSEIYLDNASTTRSSEAVRRAVMNCLEDCYGNPSSLHRKGMEAEAVIRKSAQAVAELLRVKEKEIYFTSGGTESNNWAVLGTARARKRQGRHVITSAIEHPSLRGPFEQLREEGFDVTLLPVDSQGLIDPTDLRESLREDTVLVSLMAVNNEIGSIQPWQDLGEILRRNSSLAVFHVDAVQAVGKIPIYPKACSIDLLTGSAHKIHGPKGCGFLYVAEGVRILPILYGGGQQKDLRSGTENVPGIAGLGAAAAEALAHQGSNRAALYALRHQFCQGLGALEGVRVNGPDSDAQAAPHIISASFAGIRSEVLLHALEERGIFASAGSACSSHKREISPVLKAIGLDRETAESTLRFSLSVTNTEDEIHETLKVLGDLLPSLRRFVRR